VALRAWLSSPLSLSLSISCLFSFTHVLGRCCFFCFSFPFLFPPHPCRSIFLLLLLLVLVLRSFTSFMFPSRSGFGFITPPSIFFPYICCWCCCWCCWCWCWCWCCVFCMHNYLRVFVLLLLLLLLSVLSFKASRLSR